MSLPAATPGRVDVPGSFKDPLGHVFMQDGRVFRSLTPEGTAIWRAFAETDVGRNLLLSGDLVATSDPVGIESDPGETLLEHERIDFVSYPYEWPFALLRDAARLHLRLMRELNAAGYTLKDATPFNVQWKGTTPVFIDVTSIVPETEGGAWRAFGQFCDTMLSPLMLTAYLGIAYNRWLRGAPRGLDVLDFARLIPWRMALRPGVLFHVKLRAYLERRSLGFSDGEIAVARRRLVSPAARKRILFGLGRIVDRLAPPKRSAAWTTYGESSTYDEDAKSRKAEFIRAALAGMDTVPVLVWDIGANDGTYAQLAAKHAEYVVAMESDPQTADLMAERLKEADCHNVLPLVIDFADPSPAQGWASAELQDLRSRGAPDVILALAVVHHLRISANIPLVRLLGEFAETSPYTIIEFVDRPDPMVQRLLVQKDIDYADYTAENFADALGAEFRIIDSAEIMPTRHLYICQSKRYAPV